MTNTETATRAARVHVAEVVPSRYADEIDTWKTQDFSNDVTKIRLRSRHQGGVCIWSLLYVGPEGACRREFGGDVIPGPYAALIPESTRISKHRLAGDAAGKVDLAEGDLIVVRGVAFRITDRRGRMGYNPELELVTA